VDHPLAAPDALVRPWRTATYVASGIAAFELLLLLVIGGGALVGFVSDRVEVAARERVLAPAGPRKAAGTDRKPASSKPALARARTVVMVLNGNGRTGAAAATAQRIRNRGYRIGTVGNAARTDFGRSLVMYKPGFVSEAKRLGRDLHVKQVGPLDGMRSKDLGRAHVVFILGA
jgi:LytR cell envelope-related transcriptional attenuator